MAEGEERHGEAKGVVEEVVAVLQRYPALFSAISERLAAPEPCSTHFVWARQGMQALLLLAAGCMVADRRSWACSDLSSASRMLQRMCQLLEGLGGGGRAKTLTDLQAMHTGVRCSLIVCPAGAGSQAEA